jgi:hypothetical protein
MGNINANSSVTASSKSGGVGFAGLLTILFIGLKLTGVINWSWLWILSPIWISILIVLAIVVTILAFAVMAGFLTK